MLTNLLPHIYKFRMCLLC